MKMCKMYVCFMYDFVSANTPALENISEYAKTTINF